MAIATGKPEGEPRWNAEAATVLRTVCRLSGDQHRRAMAWWKRLRERGPSDGDIAAAIRGLTQVYRIRPPWAPYAVFKRKNRELFLEAMSAGRKMQERGPRTLGQIMREIAR